MIGIICAWFNIVICVGVPTAVFAFLLKKSKQSLKIFLVGGCTYLISQVCIRQPVLSILESIDAYKIFEISNPVGYMLFISITAALIEEFGRYIAFHFVTRDCTVNNIPLYYGFGHGGIEALSVGIHEINYFLLFFLWWNRNHHIFKFLVSDRLPNSTTQAVEVFVYVVYMQN